MSLKFHSNCPHTIAFSHLGLPILRFYWIVGMVCTLIDVHKGGFLILNVKFSLSGWLRTQVKHVLQLGINPCLSSIHSLKFINRKKEIPMMWSDKYVPTDCRFAINWQECRSPCYFDQFRGVDELVPGSVVCIGIRIRRARDDFSPYPMIHHWQLWSWWYQHLFWCVLTLSVSRLYVSKISRTLFRPEVIKQSGHGVKHIWASSY
jgi:hypothetical protein